MNNQLLNMPLVEVGPNEEATPGTFGAIQPVSFLPKPLNFAQDQKVQLFIKQDLAPIIDQTRRDRANLHDEWNQIRNMNMLKHDEGRRYFGRSDSYLPVWRRNRRTLISQLSRGLFPSDEYMDVAIRSMNVPNAQEKARAAKTYMQWEMETVAKFRTRVKALLANLVDYGTAPLKIWYKKDIKPQVRPTLEASVAKIFEPSYKMGQHCIYDGLAVSPRNLFKWYVYPNNVETLDNAQIIFEDIDVSYNWIMAMQKAKRWLNIEWALSQHEISEAMSADAAQLETRGGQPRQGRGVSKHFALYPITEVWTFMELPADAYLPDEDKEFWLPTRLVLVGDVPLEVTRNPLYHQRPPYGCARIDWEAGSFYGSGEGTSVRPLQMLANDFANQSNDNGIYALNPVMIANPALLMGKPEAIKPGRTWWATDVNAAIKFDRPPYEQAQYGMMWMDRWVNMAQDATGSPPVLQGTQAAKTATGSQILQKNAGSALQDIVEDIENDVMLDVLSQGWKNAQQYREEEVMASVGSYSLKVTPEDLAMDVEWRWMASNQAMNNQVRAQNAIMFINAITPIVPMLMQMGYVVDFPVLLKRIYSDGFGFRGFDEFIRPAQAMPGQPPLAPGARTLPPDAQQPRPDQMPGVMQEQGDRARSALEQIGNFSDAAPGEAEDFMDVRAMADQTAGGFGGMR